MRENPRCHLVLADLCGSTMLAIDRYCTEEQYIAVWCGSTYTTASSCRVLSLLLKESAWKGSKQSSLVSEQSDRCLMSATSAATMGSQVATVFQGKVCALMPFPVQLVKAWTDPDSIGGGG